MSNSSIKTGADTMRVLIVDDSFLMRRIIRNIIEKDNSLEVVGEAPDGIVALEKVAELSPDIILLDIEEAREVLELGAVDIIPKPSGVLSIDFEEQKSLELLDAIHKCL